MKINEKPSNIYLIFEGRMEDISLEKKDFLSWIRSEGLFRCELSKNSVVTEVKGKRNVVR